MSFFSRRVRGFPKEDLSAASQAEPALVVNLDRRSEREIIEAVLADDSGPCFRTVRSGGEAANSIVHA